ncbi:MAG: hypothetical protein JJU36_12100, partial [Phycisphaeraceae bacterium]|nr:hypothetical protein [Phycisphaeraceae bacterium]
MWVWSRIVGLSSYMQAFSRALALVLIGFALLNVAAGMRFDGWHANGWWIATSLPLWVERMLIPGLLLCLLPWALFSSSGWGGVARVWLARLCVAGLGLLVVGNVFQVLQLWWSGWIELRTVLIFSVLVLMWLGVIGLGLVA